MRSVLSVGRATGQGQLFRYAYAVLGFPWFVRGSSTRPSWSWTLRSSRSASPTTLKRCPGTSSADDGGLARRRRRDRPRTRSRERRAHERSGRKPHFGPSGRRARGGRAGDGAGGGRRRTAREIDRWRGDDRGSWRFQGLELLTRCRLALGRLDEARSTAQVGSRGGRLGLPYAAALAQRAAAAVAPIPASPMTQRASACVSGLRRRSGPASRAHCPGCSPAARSRKRARETRRWRSWSAPPPRSTPSVQPATGLKPSASCASSAARPTGGLPAARPTAAISLTSASSSSPTRGRSEDQLPDRRRALPQPQDRRDAPAQHLRKLGVANRVELARLRAGGPRRKRCTSLTDPVIEKLSSERIRTRRRCRRHHGDHTHTHGLPGGSRS